MLRHIFFFVFLMIIFAGPSLALEQAFTDLPVSVEVLPAFSIAVDRSNIDFGIVEPGTTKVLNEGSYFNEVRCRSNYGRAWYLKAELLSGPALVGKDFTLPGATFKVKITPYQAAAAAVKATSEFESLEKAPEVIYISQAEDNLGKEVVLRFQYSFSAPKDALAGTYTGQILFTLADTP